MLELDDALGIRDFPIRAPVYLSPNGNWIAYTVRSLSKVKSSRGAWRSETDVPQELIGSELWVTEVDTGVTHRVTDNWQASSWSGPWSPDGSQLLFASDKGGVLRAWRWCCKTGATQIVFDGQIRSPWGYDAPIWSRDGSKVYLRLNSGWTSKKPIEDYRGVPRVYSSEVDGVSDTPSYGKIHTTEDYLADIVVVDLLSDHVTQIKTDLRPQCLELSNDGQSLATISLTSASNLQELYVLSVTGEFSRMVVDRIQQPFGTSLSWSPDDSRLAYISEEELWIAYLPTGELRRLTDRNAVSVGHLYQKPLWNSQGNHLLCLSGGRLLQISVDNGRVNEISGPQNKVITSFLYRNGTYCLSEQGGIIVHTLDKITKREGFFTVFPDGSHICLLEAEIHIGNSVVTFEELAKYEDVSADGSVVAYIEQASDQPPDIYITSRDFSMRRAVTRINEELSEIEFGRSETVEYSGPDGDSRIGTLLKPPWKKEKKQYPVILYVYPSGGLVNSVNVFGFGVLPLGNAQLWSTRGFALFAPDMNGCERFDIESIESLVTPSLDRLCEVDWIDAEKVGVIGHSEGGYAVNALVTSTNRFKAGVSVSGLSNLTSSYGYLWPDGRIYMHDELEKFLGGPPWEVASDYVKNSPVFHLARCATPLLLLHGTKDRGCAYTQAGEMFAGLRRLGKTVQLVVYPGEGHVMCIDWKPENIMDAWKRVFSWFEKYLEV